jgi:hypothetical protein
MYSFVFGKISTSTVFECYLCCMVVVSSLSLMCSTPLFDYVQFILHSSVDGVWIASSCAIRNSAAVNLQV